MSAALPSASPLAGGSSRALVATRIAALLVAIGAMSSPPVANVAAVLMLVAFAFVGDAWARLRRVLAEPLGRGVLLLAAALALGVVVALARGLPVQVALGGVYGWRHLLLLLVALAVFDDPRSRLRLMLGFVLFALAAAAMSMAAWKLGYVRNEMPAGILWRNPVTQALLFATGGFLALLLATRAAWAQGWMRPALGAAALLLIGTLLFTQTGRSGALALGVMLVAALLLMLRGRRLLVALLATAMLGAVVFAASPVLQQRFALGLHEMRNASELTEYNSMGARVIIWTSAAELIGERPLLGYGSGGFAPAYKAHVEARYTGWKAHLVTDAHNQYLTAWAELGLPGLLALLAFIALAVRQGLQAGHDPARIAGLGLLAAWCATSLFSSHFQTFNEGHLLMVMLGALLARDAQPPSASSTAAITAS